MSFNPSQTPESTSGSAVRYKLEIDGLRAIAVLSVLLFHVEFHWIPGGFTGVDVFFVISGYLITGLIWRDVQAGRFSFSRFYSRRIRRLAPALIVTLLVTFVVACFFLTPTHLQRFAGALLSSILSVSNLFFWAESGYFDASAELKPLLHTWSLSVEEQFYLVWPALIVFLCRFRRWTLVTVLIIMALLSLAAAKWFTSFAPSASFFLMPFRVYEFAMGALLALLPLGGLSNRVKEVLCLLGLSLIAYSVLVFNPQTPFPDVYALVPCAGAVLLITGGSAKFSGVLLRNPLSLWLGKISYSLYLVHWPVIVLYKHITFEDVIVGKTRIALLLLCFLLAGLLYILVENRLRMQKKSVSISNSASSNASILANTRAEYRSGDWRWLAVPIMLACVSGSASVFSGWPFRFDANVVRAIGDIEARQLLRRQFIEGEEPVSGRPFDTGKQVNILVMGDSHSTDMFNALYLNLRDDPLVSVRQLEIDDECLYLFAKAVSTISIAKQRRCEEQVNTVAISTLLPAAQRVVLSSRWQQQSISYLKPFAEMLGADERTVVVMGRTAEFKNVPSMVLKNGLNKGTPGLLAQSRASGLDKLNETLAMKAAELGLGYMDKVPFLCDLALPSCDAVDGDGFLLYTDYGHWTVEGARVFGRRMLVDAGSRRLLLGR